MRRKEKELTDTERIEEILTRALFCHVALCDHDRLKIRICSLLT
ncbi:hypothetical protein [Methanospirillum hungatei]|nr:hypothetical protein [Methanospirillum hungatei]